MAPRADVVNTPSNHELTTYTSSAAENANDEAVQPKTAAAANVEEHRRTQQPEDYVAGWQLQVISAALVLTSASLLMLIL
jgi:hypothetical protein